MSDSIKHVVIAGGGTAGWMTAAAMARLLGKNLQITLVESDDIPPIGVGEATIPSLHLFHDLLKISEPDFMAATNATFKLAISFENWRDRNQDYIHSFGFLGRDCWACGFQNFWARGQQLGIAGELGDYCPEHLAARLRKFAVHPKQDRNHAYHLDAGLYAKFLRKIAADAGATRVEGKISEIRQHQHSGAIKSLCLQDGTEVHGDLFIDCTGFRGLLIEQTLNTGFEDWSHLLLCDSAIAVQTELQGEQLPYTRSIANQAGWRWKIPLQSRTGNGIVYSSKYMDDSQAMEKLLSEVDGKPLTEPKQIKYRAGVRRKHWNKNCIAIGLSSGFIEPLESTSIHLIQQSILRLLQLFPSQALDQVNADKFNQKMRFELENIRDFIVLHYHLTDREDSEFWRYCKSMEIPDSLQQRMDLFRSSCFAEKRDGELFGEASWIQVMVGQGLLPENYHCVVNEMDEAELGRFLTQIKMGIANRVGQYPNHLDFIKQYCPTVKPM